MGRRPLPDKMKARRGKVSARAAKAAPAPAAPVAEVAASHGTSIEPPAVMLGLPEKQREAALTIWRELGPELERTSRLQPIHRQAFAMFCIYVAEWWEACADLAANGRSQHVGTVAGGSMERDRPVVRWRAEAFGNVMEASKQFGLTPREEYALFKDQSLVGRDNPGLFGRSSPAPANDADETISPPARSTVGSMASLKSAPPAGRA